jgi:hypothetical protein
MAHFHQQPEKPAMYWLTIGADVRCWAAWRKGGLSDFLVKLAHFMATGIFILRHRWLQK